MALRAKPLPDVDEAEPVSDPRRLFLATCAQCGRQLRRPLLIAFRNSRFS